MESSNIKEPVFKCCINLKNLSSKDDKIPLYNNEHDVEDDDSSLLSPMIILPKVLPLRIVKVFKSGSLDDPDVNSQFDASSLNIKYGY